MKNNNMNINESCVLVNNWKFVGLGCPCFTGNSWEVKAGFMLQVGQEMERVVSIENHEGTCFVELHDQEVVELGSINAGYEQFLYEREILDIPIFLRHLEVTMALNDKVCVANNYSVRTAMGAPVYFDEVCEIIGNHIHYKVSDKETISSAVIESIKDGVAYANGGLAYKLGDMDQTYNEARHEVIKLRQKLANNNAVFNRLQRYLTLQIMELEEVAEDLTRNELIGADVFANRAALLTQVKSYLSKMIS